MTSDLTYPIPKNSSDVFKVHKSQKYQNPGLVFDRFAPDWSDEATIKKTGLGQVIESTKLADPALLEQWNKRWNSSVEMTKVEKFNLKTDWRMVAGLGRKGSFEVGFTFNRYGFPYLPGSSIKGIARAFALGEIAEKMKSDKLSELLETLLLEEEEYEKKSQGFPDETGMFRLIFGSTEQAGLAIFHDAIPDPKSLPQIELDIMNPHYPKYYEGREYPTDWQSPIPVYFLTVASNTVFHFAVGWRGSTTNNKLLKQAQTWLEKGLKTLGAGGKTSAGYGYFGEVT